jgi:diaminohydroxyphosphoribosylaminopyrimidine deaminase / 5-amino-6-(5-phosphoribosylamino)uracil reductase
MSGDRTHFLRMALGLAAAGRGRVEPNPLVGCVIVRDGAVVGQGYHARYGGPHAEIVALDSAGDGARGATAYVTLEPCGHQGKTPPCAEALIAAGVARVVYASRDPNSVTSGKGLGLLGAAGIPAQAGGLEREALAQNRRFARWLEGRFPWTIAKWGASLDGRVADAVGGSTYITGDRSRRLVHEIRGAVDAIMVGIGTVLADDPLLTCRLPGLSSPRRIILDGSLRTPADGQIAGTADEIRTTIVAHAGADASARRALEARGCEILVCADDDPSLAGLFARLRRDGVLRMLLEGGPTVMASALAEGLIDQVMAFQAPLVLGGREAPGPVGGKGVATVDNPLRLADMRVERIGDDVLIEGFLDARKGRATET